MTSKVRGGLRGGKCWFVMESKTFEISIKVVGENQEELFEKGAEAFPLG